MRRGIGRWEEEDSLHTVYLQLYLELIAYPCLLYVTEAYHPEILVSTSVSTSRGWSRAVSFSKIVNILVSVSVLVSTISSFSVSNWDWLLRVSKAETNFKKSWSRELRLSFKDVSLKHDTILTWLLNFSSLCLLLVWLSVSIFAFELLLSLGLQAWDCVSLVSVSFSSIET